MQRFHLHFRTALWIWKLEENMQANMDVWQCHRAASSCLRSKQKHGRAASLCLNAYRTKQLSIRASKHRPLQQTWSTRSKMKDKEKWRQHSETRSWGLNGASFGHTVSCQMENCVYADVLLSNTRPKTVWSRSSVLQFHRWCLNWCWHSLIHSLVPSPMACMMSGWRWQSCLCLFTRPGMLSQITRAPRAPIYLRVSRTEKTWVKITFAKDVENIT